VSNPLNFNLNRIWFLILNIILFLLTSFLFSHFEEFEGTISFVYLLLFSFLIIKRLKHIGVSLWRFWLILIPFINLGFIIYLFVKKGDDSFSNYSFKKSSVPEDVLDKKFDQVIEELISGNYSSMFNSNVILKKGEVLIFDIPQVSFCEERSIKFKGNSRGFSVRLMKGVSYRFGEFEGGVEKRVTELDSGNLTLTNKRLIFSGNTKSVEYNLSRIVSITPLNSGVMINRSGKTKTEYFLNTTNLTISMKILPEPHETFKEETVKYRLTGHELKELIQKVLSK